MTIEVLASARNDLADGRRFYERQGGVALGSYFFDAMFSAIDSLMIYGAIYRRKYGFRWMLTPHFPYSVYYDIKIPLSVSTRLWTIGAIQAGLWGICLL